MAFPGMAGMPLPRLGPSKLRMSSSDTPVVSQPGLHLPGVAGLDAFSNPFPGQTPDQGPMAASSLHAALQQQHMVQQASLGVGPGSLPGSQPGSSNGAAAAAAMSQAAALMAGMGQDPSMPGAAGLTGMMHGMMDAAGGMDTAGMNQMQMLMYYAHLGMMAHMNGGPPMGLPGTPTAVNSNPMAAAAAGGMAPNPMMFSMMNPQQLAAFSATQQQWPPNMPASAIANIAAAAAVAATAASNPEVCAPLCVGVHLKHTAVTRVASCLALTRSHSSLSHDVMIAFTLLISMAHPSAWSAHRVCTTQACQPNQQHMHCQGDSPAHAFCLFVLPLLCPTDGRSLRRQPQQQPAPGRCP